MSNKKPRDHTTTLNGPNFLGCSFDSALPALGSVRT